MKSSISAFVAGLIFSLGLGISGMTQPHIVQGFLDVFGQWNWSLMGVMAGAIGFFAIAYRLIIKKSSPLFADKFNLPNKTQIDRPLIMGAIVFGLGWGWAGICPGPALTSMMGGHPFIFIFVISMIAGMKLYSK